MDGVNLADFKTVMDDNCNGWGGGNSIIWLLVFFGIMNGGFGWGGNRGGNCATTEDLASGFNFSSLQSKGNDILAAVNAEGRTTDNAICQLGNGLMQQLFAMQQAQSDCCCATQRAIDGVKFDMANYASGIMQNDTANTQKVLDKLCGMELAQEQRENANLRARVQQLENREYVQAATAGIPRINTDGWGVFAYPTCGGAYPINSNCCCPSI